MVHDRDSGPFRSTENKDSPLFIPDDQDYGEAVGADCRHDSHADIRGPAEKQILLKKKIMVKFVLDRTYYE